MMFVGGGLVLFAVTIGRYLDPPRPNEWIRSVSDSVDMVYWRWADASRRVLGGVGDVSLLSGVDMNRSA